MEEETVSRRIVNSCQVHHQDQSSLLIALIGLLQPDVFEKYNISLVGSRAELSIEPVNSEFGDIDIIVNKTDDSAASRYSAVELDQNSDRCKLKFYLNRARLKNFEILYTRQDDTGTFSFEMIENLLNPGFLEAYGRANKYRLLECERCPDWSPDAEHWSRRQRLFDWPRPETIKEIIGIGFDLVNTSHEDQTSIFSQRRYSFARAEVILLRTWTRTQQIIYHMLRYFVKLEWAGDKEQLNVYHIKTLMLWASEEKRSVFWESECAIYICAVLLENLSVWLTRGICRHYFIPEWNLFEFQTKDDKLNQCIEAVKLHSNPKKLTEWFKCNYLQAVYGKDLIPSVDSNGTEGESRYWYFRRECLTNL